MRCTRSDTRRNERAADDGSSWTDCVPLEASDSPLENPVWVKARGLGGRSARKGRVGVSSVAAMLPLSSLLGWEIEK